MNFFSRNFFRSFSNIINSAKIFKSILLWAYKTLNVYKIFKSYNSFLVNIASLSTFAKFYIAPLSFSYCINEWQRIANISIHNLCKINQYVAFIGSLI